MQLYSRKLPKSMQNQNGEFVPGTDLPIVLRRRRRFDSSIEVDGPPSLSGQQNCFFRSKRESAPRAMQIRLSRRRYCCAHALLPERVKDSPAERVFWTAEAVQRADGFAAVPLTASPCQYQTVSREHIVVHGRSAALQAPRPREMGAHACRQKGSINPGIPNSAAVAVQALGRSCKAPAQPIG